MRTIYCDYNATTPVDPRVVEAMLPWLAEHHGNPSSAHAFGRAAREAVEAARAQVAAMLEVAPPELVFTGSGTEANNSVLWALARQRAFSGHLVLSAIEHPSILAAATELEALGVRVSRVAPSREGVVEVETVVGELTDETFGVALMLANNELGTVQPVRQVAEACRRRGVPVLTDAVQAVGKIDVLPNDLGVDYLVIAAHKFYGPLGAAALWVRPGASYEPLLVGGGQERRRRAGTENVPALVGLGTAAELVRAELVEGQRRMAALRDRFEQGLAVVPDVVLHATGVERLPNTSHPALLGTQAHDLMIRLDLAGYAVSTGSACGSGAVSLSSTLAAVGMAEKEALASLRVSFGWPSTREEVDGLLAAIEREVAALRSAERHRAELLAGGGS